MDDLINNKKRKDHSLCYSDSNCNELIHNKKRKESTNSNTISDEKVGIVPFILSELLRKRDLKKQQ